MDVQYKSLRDGANILTWNLNNGTNQRFFFNKFGEIIAMNSMKCLTADSSAGGNVSQHTCDGRNEQKWDYDPVHSDGMHLKLAAAPSVYLIEDGHHNLVASQTSSPTLWHNYDSIDGSIVLITDTPFTNVNPGVRTLSVQNASTASMAPLVFEQPHGLGGADHQQFKILRVDWNIFIIKNVRSNKCVGVANGSRNPGAQLLQEDCNKQRARLRWRISRDIEDLVGGSYPTYYIQSQLSNLYLDKYLDKNGQSQAIQSNAQVKLPIYACHSCN